MLVRLKMLGNYLVLMAQIIVRVVLQKCMDCLEKKFVLGLEIAGSCMCYWTVLGCC